MSKQRPGVLLYFSIRPCLKRLSLEEKGALFEGILDYAQHGVWPDFDGVLGVAWDFVVPLLDADAEAYRSKCEKAKRAADTRWDRQREYADGCAGMRTDAENANTNPSINNNNTFNSNLNGNGVVCTVEPIIAPIYTEMPDTAPMRESDFEDRRRIQIERFRSWGG